MNNGHPTVFVITYDRAHSLLRLLRSLAKVRFETPPELVISIDCSGNREVAKVAGEYQWPGEKTVLKRSERLGLKKHILSCGAFSEANGAVIVLEDDLIAAPGLYEFAVAAEEFFSGDTAVAGVSLHSYSYNESAGLPFVPLAPGNGNYFAQLPSSWGQLWTAGQWKLFKDWLGRDRQFDDRLLPPNVRAWPESSWKKEYLRYMIDTDRYFVYPGTSFTANCGEVGQHVFHKSAKWVPAMVSSTFNFDFHALGGSTTVYDAYLEMIPSILRDANPRLADFEFCVDLYGQKYRGLDPESLILTTLPAENKLASFGLELKPPELNILLDIEGEGIHLCRVEDISSGQVTPALLRYCYPIDDWNLPAIMPPLREQIRSRVDYSIKKLTHSDKRSSSS